ncbi:leucine rich repeat containing 51 [Thecamonas trahens ATCC 50062]|uniref:Leucine rich repeat containing 51 n=1 Tax=Thecamonas trahens ATCC 50062 TaxID=461836 RepID=A0A0L0DMU4_THETB|nr:leucine rich repeat containing 51 [Thecamonas trahens ATCC 50062]KNC53570.1 leucine rich repeat containing 51 [Thecamonas trahens ATCC 50062]|eukprot:XP_013761887.1 leucine rich repeat containing 51 [Thecamonas trahens ATCC 50062]
MASRQRPAAPLYRNVQSRIAAGTRSRAALPPLDYSFKELTDVLSIVHEEPRSGYRRIVEIDDEEMEAAARQAAVLGGVAGDDGDDVEAGASAKALSGPQTKGRGKGKAPSRPPGITTAIRLCNNYLSSLDGLEEALAEVLDEPAELKWIDLSFNALVDIDEVLTFFPHLTTLYLHGNNIGALPDADNDDDVAAVALANDNTLLGGGGPGDNDDDDAAAAAAAAATARRRRRKRVSLDMVDKLGLLPNLKALTLHGNPIESHPHYKNYVLSVCPSLRHLDFTGVTRADRAAAQAWASMHRARYRARSRPSP